MSDFMDLIKYINKSVMKVSLHDEDGEGACQVYDHSDGRGGKRDDGKTVMLELYSHGMAGDHCGQIFISNEEARAIGLMLIRAANGDFNAPSE